MGNIMESVPIQKGCRWFVKKGATTKFNRGFKSKAEAWGWIDSLGKLEWRAGGLFKMYDCIDLFDIVNRRGFRPRL